MVISNDVSLVVVGGGERTELKPSPFRLTPHFDSKRIKSIHPTEVGINPNPNMTIHGGSTF